MKEGKPQGEDIKKEMKRETEKYKEVVEDHKETPKQINQLLEAKNVLDITELQISVCEKHKICPRPDLNPLSVEKKQYELFTDPQKYKNEEPMEVSVMI